MMVASGSDPWQWQPHPEVWALIIGIVLVGGYGVRVIAPKVVPAGDVAVTSSQKRWFVSAVLLLWLAADYPFHDIGEDHLYSVHMIQHLIITFVVPPMFLKATPEWLARLVLLDDGVASRWVRRLARPVPAAVIFNALVIFLHWQTAVTKSVENGPFHFTMHVLIFTSALLMWVPVVGPLPEMRISVPARMVYLFMQSVVPTVPGGWLTFAQNPVYRIYDRPDRLWGIDVLTDQQAAGAIMKILGGFYLWVIIAILFFRWAGTAERSDGNWNRVVEPRPDPVPAPAGVLPENLTFESVSAAFDRSGPAPRERVPGGPDESPPA
jgi:putative membrane protein